MDYRKDDDGGESSTVRNVRTKFREKPTDAHTNSSVTS